MNNYAIGAGITLGLGALSWAVYMTMQVRYLRGQALSDKETAEDEEIENRDINLTDDERNALAEQNLGSGNPETK